ncbi:TPA: Gfo/Idh/MocA family oxidoreductase [Candidatus Poribacteria bacterium]|nr:Gfo/Idh/MocA family oxidoreductase [Candidatus Poribacteria bacterium]HIB92560.1 Gfo/Idh/MocA family oxidoreductase [Candidatus Poribacteria bacterium]HIB99849.1 Gfo/Idh/MocA family oxidoreductase [Candidatus Poribacteria bacterium]HIC16481.1 Gfo/Idh/MocA family oxidoreductase [Candidatus Poribacteria bacterium]HIN28735.1 Gfo/Idh/MocA family oxidoreductase [Candidatus Poribacteria bacterium]
MDRIRIAFIGCGGMSSQLQRCIPMIPEFNFIATCDLVEERAQSNARKFGALRHYTNYDQMLGDEELDAVAVVGRPEDKLHRDIGIECLERGYHIYVEKPPATTVEGAKSLVDASVRTGKTGMVGTMWRHAPAHQMAKRLIEEDDFGRVCQYHTRYLAPSPRIHSSDAPFAWPFMLDQAIHPTDCMRFFMGPVNDVFSFDGTDTDTGTVSISVNLRYANGAVGTMTLGIGPVLEAMVYVKGSNNQAIQVLETRKLRRYRVPTWSGQGGGYADTPTEEWDLNTAFHSIGRPGYLEEMQHWAKSLLQGVQPEASLEDACQSMKVLKAISDSIETGTVISLS